MEESSIESQMTCEAYDIEGKLSVTDEFVGEISIGEAPNYTLVYSPLSTDLNQDGTVNILDIAIVAQAFGTKEGDTHYNVVADLDSNGEVNIIDLSTVAIDYGKTV